MGQAAKRNSSIELLRILCIFGIIFMHTIAYGGEEIADYNRYIQIVINCFTNLGVTCFMLISGYFGVKLNLTKLIKLDLMVIFYSLAYLGISVVLGYEVGKLEILSCIFPVLSNRYWYVTVYFVIVLLSPFINQIPEKLSRENLLKLIFIFLFLSSVVSTFLSFDLLGREGKNILHMTNIYLIGRYIRKYDRRTYKNSRILLLLAANLAVTLVLEFGLYLTTGRYSMFYRDCSIFTVCSSILLFTIFRNMHFESKFINRISTAVLAVYVFSYGFQRIVYQLIPLEEYAFSPLFFPRICVFAPCVVIGCILTELLRQQLLGKTETKLAERLEKQLHKILETGRRIGGRVTGSVIRFIGGKEE